MALEKIAQTIETNAAARQETGEHLRELLRNRDVFFEDESGQAIYLQSEGHMQQGDKLHIPALWDFGSGDVDATGQMRERAAAVDRVVVPADVHVSAPGRLTFDIYEGERAVGAICFSRVKSMDKSPIVALQLVQ